MTAPFQGVEPLRRRIMSAFRERDTKPEMVVRRLVHSMDYRYRLHHRYFPGSPDMVFGKRRKAILVHAVFWHRHPGCLKATSPKARSEFWSERFECNVERDRQVASRLADMGTQSLVVWRCEIREPEALTRQLRRFLDEPSNRPDAERMAA